MIAPVPHFTPPPTFIPAPFWKCCQVVGDPGETECWVCGKAVAPAKPPALHTSTGSTLRSEFPDDLPEVDHLIERSPA